MLYITTSRNKGLSDTVLWKEVEEGWIRYDQQSGSTQLFNPLARFVIDLIDRSLSPLSASAITIAVVRVEPDADPGDCQLEVEAVLRVLSEAQLIQPIQH